MSGTRRFKSFHSRNKIKTKLFKTFIMSNEIKFRWVGLNKKFGNIQINSDLTTSKLLSRNFLSFFNESNRGADGNCEFLSEDLFSGLKDIKGVDLYYHDIIQFQSTEGEGLIKKVWYCTKKNSLMIGNLTYQNLHESGFFQPSELEFEIIGNIYEFPELLKN